MSVKLVGWSREGSQVLEGMELGVDSPGGSHWEGVKVDSRVIAILERPLG